MIIFDDVFEWDGWGGMFKLASGKCHLRIYDLTRNKETNLTLLKPIFVVVSELVKTESAMKYVSIRSCAGHIATCVTQQFQINPGRMIFVEYYPQQSYGQKQEHIIPERFDAVYFKWHSGRALQPIWRPLPAALTQVLSELMGTI